ncbi:MAG: hypothetical protein AABW72_05660 [archaeon]
MLELTEKRLASLLWMLKNKGKKWSVLELNKGSAVLSYRPTFSFVKELEEKGFVRKDLKTAEYSVTRVVDLVRFVSLARPIQSLKTLNFHSPFEFSKTLKMIQESKLSHAFTVFAGSELYRPYVKTDQVHVYIMKGEEEKWGKYLLSKNCLKAQKSQANLFLIPTEQEALFKDAAKVKGYSVVPIPILLSDLLSFGGLAGEQANFLMEEWLNNRL